MSILTFGLGQSGGGAEIGAIRFSQTTDAEAEFLTLDASIVEEIIDEVELVKPTIDAELIIPEIDAELDDDC